VALLVLAPEPHGQGSFRPTFAEALRGALGALVRLLRAAAVGVLLHLLLAQLDVLDAVDVGDVVLFEAALHLLEEVEALALVLDERVSLGEAAPADALAQVVHLVEVLPPAGVHHREQRPALGLLEGGDPVGAGEAPPLELRHPGVPLDPAILQAPPGVFEDHLEDLLARQGLYVEALQVDRARVEAVDLRLERVEVPLLGVDVGRGVLGDDPGKYVLDVPGGVHVLAHQDVAPDAVDHLALLVEHVVVLEDSFTHLEVAALYLLLRAAYGVGDHAGLDRHVLLEPYALDKGPASSDPRRA
jgi:hypothetical protein